MGTGFWNYASLLALIDQITDHRTRAMEDLDPDVSSSCMDPIIGECPRVCLGSICKPISGETMRVVELNFR